MVMGVMGLLSVVDRGATRCTAYRHPKRGSERRMSRATYGRPVDVLRWEVLRCVVELP